MNSIGTNAEYKLNGSCLLLINNIFHLTRVFTLASVVNILQQKNLLATKQPNLSFSKS